MKKKSILVFIVFCTIVVITGADTVKMKDGSVLVGEVFSVGEKMVGIKTPYGELLLEKNQILSLEFNPDSIFFQNVGSNFNAEQDFSDKKRDFEVSTAVSVSFLQGTEISPLVGFRYYPKQFIGISAYLAKSVYHPASFYGGIGVDGIVSIKFWKPMLSLGLQGGLYDDDYSEGLYGFFGMKLSVAVLRLEVNEYTISLGEFSFLSNFLAEEERRYQFEINIAQVGFLF